VLHPEAPDLAGAHNGKAAADGSAGAGWIAGRDESRGSANESRGSADESRLAGEGDRTRRPAQERQSGRAAGCRAGGEGTRADGQFWEVGADGRDTARAQARASRPRGRWRKRERRRARHRWRPAACMRATQCGTHAGHTMRGACKRANRQVGGRERDRSCGQGHHAPHGHGQGMDMATGSDAFGITSLYIILNDTRHLDCCYPSSTLCFPPSGQALTNSSAGLHVCHGAHVLAEDCDFICRDARGGPTCGAAAVRSARLTLQR
jgi:hypothetical protein